MNNLNVQKIMIGPVPTLVVDSRLVAERLGVRHSELMGTVNECERQIQQVFGPLQFQFAEAADDDHPKKYALLTEDQALFLLCRLRNTSQAAQCRSDVATAFFRGEKFVEVDSNIEFPPLSRMLKTLDCALPSSESIAVFYLAMKALGDCFRE